MYNPDYEKAIIGTALLKTVPEIFTLSPDHFCEKQYIALFKIILKINRAGNQVSMLTVSAELNDQQKAWFIANFSTTYSSPSIDTIIREVKRMARRRSYIALISDLNDKFKDDQLPEIEDAIVIYDREVKNIQKDNKSRALIFGDEGLGWERFHKKFMSTGVSFIDDILRGFTQTQFIVIAARPGQGKSALALEIARYISANKKVLFFNLEMDFSEIELRLCTMYSKIEMDKIASGEMTDEEKERYIKAEKTVFEKYKNLKIHDNIFYIEDIKIEAQKESLDDKLGLVIIDYLQLCKTRVKADRRVQVDEISRECKLMAKELRVPVIALAQLSRLAEGEEPKLSHLRESGAIEQDANVVMFLYQTEDQVNTDIVKFTVNKNRQGRTGIRDIYFNKKYLEFRSLVKNPENYQDIPQ
jgi:replicative DNA helicase